MARRQMRIPGTENAAIPDAVVEAGEEWLDLRREARRHRDKAKEGKTAVLLLMQQHKIAEYAVKDPDTGEILDLYVETETKLKTRRRHEADDIEVGEGIPASSAPDAGVHPNLIAQAEKANLDNGVAETDDGDVVPPDEAAPKGKRKRKAKVVEVESAPAAAGSEEVH